MRWYLRNPWTARIGDENEPEHDWQWTVWFLGWSVIPALLIVGMVLGLCAVV